MKVIDAIKISLTKLSESDSVITGRGISTPLPRSASDLKVPALEV